VPMTLTLVGVVSAGDSRGDAALILRKCEPIASFRADRVHEFRSLC